MNRNISVKTYYILFVLLFFYSFSTSAFAYLDPGTGSIIIQGIIAGIAGIAIVIKVYWYKFLSIFQKKDKKEVSLNSGDDQENHNN